MTANLSAAHRCPGCGRASMWPFPVLVERVDDGARVLLCTTCLSAPPSPPRWHLGPLGEMATVECRGCGWLIDTWLDDAAPERCPACPDADRQPVTPDAGDDEGAGAIRAALADLADDDERVGVIRDAIDALADGWEPSPWEDEADTETLSQLAAVRDTVAAAIDRLAPQVHAETAAIGWADVAKALGVSERTAIRRWADR